MYTVLLHVGRVDVHVLDCRAIVHEERRFGLTYRTTQDIYDDLLDTGKAWDPGHLREEFVWYPCIGRTECDWANASCTQAEAAGPVPRTPCTRNEDS